MEYARFPARVQFDDGRRMKKAAVVVAGNRTRVAERVGHGAVVVLDRDDTEDVTLNANRSVTITFSDSATLTIGKGDGCSCGSPLKTWYSQAIKGTV